MNTKQHIDQYTFKFQQATLSYSVIGTGSKTMLAFHGFGQTKEAFSSFAETMHQEYKIYSFDLFYHGYSNWEGDLSLFSNSFWTQLIDAFLKENNIEKVTVCGFSIGAKLALATVLAVPHQTEELILIAPDGIKNNFWFKVATGPAKSLFKKLSRQPQIIYKAATLLNKVRLLNNPTYLLAQSQLSDITKMQRVYNTWMLFAGLKLNINTLVDLINTHKITTVIFIGKRDRIIKASNLTSFVSSLNKSELHILNSNHSSLIRSTAEFYRSSNSKKV